MRLPRRIENRRRGLAVPVGGTGLTSSLSSRYSFDARADDSDELEAHSLFPARREFSGVRLCAFVAQHSIPLQFTQGNVRKGVLVRFVDQT